MRGRSWRKNVSEVPEGVSIASNGGLLLTGGAHEVLALMTGVKRPPESSPTIFWANDTARKAFCGKRNIAYSLVVFPDKLTTYGTILGNENIGSLYLREYAQKNAAPEDPLYLDLDADDYFLTDTHLSTKGLISAAGQIMARFGGDQGFYQHYTERLVDGQHFVGDLGAKFNPRRSEMIDVAKGVNQGVQVSNGMISGNDGAIDIVVNEYATSDRTVLIYGDSFFRQMLGPLSYFFKRIICVRTRYFHYECIDAIRPDIILAGCAERYLSRVYRDSDRPHFLSYPLNYGRAINPPPDFVKRWNELVDIRVLARCG